MDEVPVSQPDSKEEVADSSVPPDKKRRLKSWMVVERFADKQEAEIFLKNENTWSRTFSRDTDEGRKLYYRCNKVKSKGPQCDSELYLLFVNDRNDVIAYKTTCEHNHDVIGTYNHGISEAAKSEIDKLFELRLKPRAILEALSKIEGIAVPTSRQLNNYLSARKRERFTKPSIKLSELEKWIFDRTSIPEDENEVFVISYCVLKADEPSFRFALSTKNLLKVLCYTDILHVDATHKIIWQGYPVFIFGTTDRNRKFHPLCLGVSTNERQEDFQMFFCGLKEKVLALFDYVMEPKVLVCDAANSIKNGFIEVFGDTPVIRMCWAHAKKNIQQKVQKLISDKDDRKHILEDIDALHNANSHEVFNTASQAFVEKWLNEARFISYFEEEWLIKHPNWFLGAAPFSPVTNNALEAFNRNIKDHNTLRECLPLSQFLTIATEMVAQWSLQNSEESIPETLTIELKQWTDGYCWAKQNVEINVISSDSTEIEYLIKSSQAEEVSYDQPWSNFDDYKKINSAYWKVTLPKTETQDIKWTQGLCTCPQFYKQYVCEHVIGLAIRLKLTSPPLEAKVLPIGQKRNRGRPTKSRPALIIQ